MKNIKLLSKENHAKLIQRLSADRLTYAPVRQGKRVNFKRISTADDMSTDYILTDMSAKSFVFPRIEKLFGYTKDANEVEIKDFDPETIPLKVVFGVRPCDAMGIEALSAIFEWEPKDPIYELRKERTTIVSYSCAVSDEYCFCTSVGGGPGNATGSDILLTRIADGGYLAEILTTKGEVIVNFAPELFDEAPSGEFYDEASLVVFKEKYLANVPVRFDISELKKKINATFDMNIFDEYAMRCLGCGACAYVCPTCACFDIQDEAKGKTGERLRSWDSCGLKLFTLHTSGHNPRDVQGARWRQRIMHKFSYMPERLEVTGCVGCGRCSRKCPVDMNIAECLKKVSDAVV